MVKRTSKDDPSIKILNVKNKIKIHKNGNPILFFNCLNILKSFLKPILSNQLGLNTNIYYQSINNDDLNY